ncbi:hypothetical protein V8F33_005508 [Rhypophila sp. PSN 637]
MAGDGTAGQGITPEGFLAVIWTLAALATVLLGGRILVRHVLHGSYHADDAFAILAWALMIATIALATAVNPLSYRLTSVLVGDSPMPPMDVWMDMNLELRRYNVAGQSLFWASIFAVKFSFMFLYRLVVQSVQQYRRVWYIAMLFIVISFGVCLIGVYGQCIEAGNLFDLQACSTPRVADYSAKMIWVVFAFNVASDLIVVLILVPIIWNLQMQTKQKLAFLGVCSLAIITIAFEVVRTVKLSQLNFNLTNLYSYLELLVAVIISTLPTFSFAISNTEKSREYRRLLWSRITLASYRSNNGSNHSVELRDHTDNPGFKRTASSVQDSASGHNQA